MSVKVKYTRRELIALCEAAVVRMDRWHDRDSAGAQRQVGEAWALLRAECPITVYPAKGSPSADDTLQTDAQTVWIEIRSRGFDAFEYGDNTGPHPSGYGEGDNYDERHYYIPTRHRLAMSQGRDWY